MRCHRRTAALSLLLLLGAPAAAAAQADATREVAKKHYELGEKLFQTSSYAEALVEFGKAYKLQPYPELLYNIARCHEVLADLKQAVRYYQLFLDKKPDTRRRALVQARLKTLKRRIAAQRSAAPAAPDPRGQPPAADPGGGWKRTTGWVALGLGGAALVSGAIFGALARGKASDFADGVARGQPFEELDALDRAGKRYETLQVVGLIVGGVVAAAGGGLLLWDRLGGEQRSAGVTPLLGDGAVGLAGSVRF